MDLARRKGSTGAPITRFHDEFDELFNRFFGDMVPAERSMGGWWPDMDIAEREDALVVRADLPGVKPEDINISVQGNTLTLSGEKKEEKEEKRENYYHVERRSGSFRREFTLTSGVDPEKIQAEYHDGVLTVTLPKSEQAKPKRITVKAA